MRLRASIVAAGLLVGGVTVASASPASADTWPCDGVGDRIAKNPDGTIRPAVIEFPAHHSSQQAQDSYGGWVGHGYWTCSMSYGSSGPHVQRLQATLNLCYDGIIDARLSTDGDFGPLTKAALVKVQQFHGISADGGYGPQTSRTIHQRVVLYDNGVVQACAPMSWAGYPGNSYYWG